MLKYVDLVDLVKNFPNEYLATKYSLENLFQSKCLLAEIGVDTAGKDMFKVFVEAMKLTESVVKIRKNTKRSEENTSNSLTKCR